MRIEKKTWPELFQRILNGEKTFDVRLADFACTPGDTLVLREYDPKTRQYSGRKIEKHVSFVLKTKEMEFWPKEDVERWGLQIIAWKSSP